MSTYLVTTADRRAWPTEGDRAVMLWRSCIGPYGTDLGTRDWALASPFYPDVAGRLALVDEANAIFESVMPRLAEVLNAYHGVQYQRRQWEIIAGPFLTRYVRTILNRYRKLELCVRDDRVSHAIHLRRPVDVAPVDTVHMISLTEVDAWNHEVCSWLLRDFFPSVVIEERDVADSYVAEVSELHPATNAVRVALERLRARRRLYVNDMHASRPLKLEFYLRSGQLWLTPQPLRLNATSTDRAALALPTDGNAQPPHRQAIDRYLPRLLPKYLVETFEQYRHQVEREQLDHRPRTMVTSTAFDGDEVFKMKVADEIGRGGRYVVLQHGAVYGVNPFLANTVEERTADAFVTWGWSRRAADVAGFCLTTPGQRITRASGDDRIVLVTLPQRRKKFLWDVEAEFDNYLAGMFGLVDGLGDLKKKLTVRLHAAHARTFGYEREKFLARYPGIAIDPGYDSFWKTAGNYRLAIFSYDSTGLLEMLNMNEPVIGFWPADGFDQVGTDAAPFYQLLIDAGIVHHSPEELATFLTQNWQELRRWWESPKVQDARTRFCARYAAPVPRGAARRLRRLVRGDVNQRQTTALTPTTNRA